MAPEPHASHLSPHKGDAILGCAGKCLDSEFRLSICSLTNLLSASRASGVSPTPSSQPSRGSLVTRNNQPFAVDSIQHVKGSEFACRRAATAKAIRSPKLWMEIESRSGRDAM